MTDIGDPPFQDAIAALDAGDVAALRRLLDEHPRLAGARLEEGEGYFARPYLLWFVAENPIRRGRLPENIREVTRAILDAPRQRRIDSFREQVDGALAFLLRLGVDLNANGPKEFHPHATALRQAAGSGSLDAVRVLIEAGADLRAQDRVDRGTPLGWAEHGGHSEIAAWLRERAGTAV